MEQILLNKSKKPDQKEQKIMKKTITFLMLMVMLLFCLAACASGDNSTDGEEGNAEVNGDTITVVDHLGEEVVLPANVERIAIYDIYPIASVLSVFFNSAEKIVAMPEPSLTAAKNGLLKDLYPEILSVETDCVSGAEINTEELMKLSPDVVFYSASNPAAGEALRNAGFAAVAISVNKWDYDCIETLNNWIALFSEIFPEDAKADLVKEYSDKSYALVSERVATLSPEERARIFVLFQYSDTVMLSSGKNFFGQWWCDAIGAVNVAEELEQDNSVQVNMEQVYSWDPDVILVTNFTQAQPEDIYQSTVGNDDWSGIKAVQQQRVYKMPLGIYRSYTPGADTPVTLLWLAKTVYPQLFEDIDVTQEAKDYYQAVFGVELTDEQIESIFAPVSAAAVGF